MTGLGGEELAQRSCAHSGQEGGHDLPRAALLPASPDVSSLKGHDMALLLTYLRNPGGSVGSHGQRLGVARSEAYRSTERLVRGGLLTKSRRPRVGGVRSFLEIGFPVVFYPVWIGGIAAGVMTGICGVRGKADGATPVVWPANEGLEVGIGLEPLFPGAATTLRTDPDLYVGLVILDAIRVALEGSRSSTMRLLETWVLDPAALESPHLGTTNRAGRGAR